MLQSVDEDPGRFSQVIGGNSVNFVASFVYLD